MKFVIAQSTVKNVIQFSCGFLQGESGQSDLQMKEARF